MNHLPNQTKPAMKAFSIIIGLLIIPAMVYYEKTIEIKGTVIDAVERTPLKDCHVYVKGTNIGIVTGEDGKFTLQIPVIYKNKPLVVSYVGYSSFEEKVSVVQQLDVQIAMEHAVVSLDEIIIMPGKELLVDQAIDKVLAEYDDQEEMLEDFYAVLLFMDHDYSVLNRVMKNDTLRSD